MENHPSQNRKRNYQNSVFKSFKTRKGVANSESRSDTLYSLRTVLNFFVTQNGWPELPSTPDFHCFLLRIWNQNVIWSSDRPRNLAKAS